MLREALSISFFQPMEDWEAVAMLTSQAGEDEGIVVPTVEAGEQGCLHVATGVAFPNVGSELDDAIIPHITGSFGRALKHTGSVFGDSVPRASVIILQQMNK